MSKILQSTAPLLSVVTKALICVVAVIALAVACTSTASGATGSPYSTTFPLTQNPISEGGNWINGLAVGLDWADVATTPGLAFGTQSGAANYNDSTAVLAGTWGPNQTAQATVHTVNQQSGSIYEEVELRLRTTITAHSLTGYEFNFSCRSDGSQYVQIVRWNGALGDFTLLDARTGPGLHNGDVVKATISGSTLTTYINNVAIFSVTDSTFTNGSPGIGFYLQGAGGLNSDYGFTSFSASDGSTAAPPVVASASFTENYGSAFSYQISATNSPTSYSTTDLNLLPGLSLSSTGLISGTLPNKLGNYLVGLSATNAGGTGKGNLALKIVDATPPSITSLTPSIASISPPDKRMVSVTLTPGGTNLGSNVVFKIISVTSNEPDSSVQWQITGPLSLNLLADRLGGSGDDHDEKGNGRVYTITVQATDRAGSTSTKSTTVTVPRDQGDKGDKGDKGDQGGKGEKGDKGN
jgi:hypothetical protein